MYTYKILILCENTVLEDILAASLHLFNPPLTPLSMLPYQMANLVEAKIETPVFSHRNQ